MCAIISLVGALLICGNICTASNIYKDNDYLEQDETSEDTDKSTKNEKLFITTLNGILGHRDTSSTNTLIFAKSTPSTLQVWKVFNVSEFSSTPSQQYEEIEQITTKSVHNTQINSKKVNKKSTTVASKVKLLKTKMPKKTVKNKATPKNNTKRNDKSKKVNNLKVTKSVKNNTACPPGKNNCSPKTRSAKDANRTLDKPQYPKPKHVKHIKMNNLNENFKGVKPKLPSKTNNLRASTNKNKPKKTDPKKTKMDPKNMQTQPKMTKLKQSKSNSKRSKSSSKPGNKNQNKKRRVKKTKKDNKNKQPNKRVVSNEKLKGPEKTTVAPSSRKAQVKNYVDPSLLNSNLDVVGMVKKVFFD